MGVTVDINVCDVTGKAYGPRANMDVVEVYQIGGRYPEENECLTAITLAPDVLPEHTGEFVIYTDSDFNVLAFKDDHGSRPPAEDETELADQLSDAISTILSADYDRTDTIESIEVNGREITGEL